MLITTLLIAGIAVFSGAGQTPAPAAQSPEIVIIPPERRNVPGQRLTLSLGELFIPDYWRANAGGQVDVVIFFHGAAWVAEQTFYDAEKNGVLLSITLKNYQEVFQEPARFQATLDEVVTAIEKARLARPARINRICLASFSGGYTAVREILQHEADYSRVTDLLLADSLYCAYVDPETRVRLREDQLAPFLRFARDAGQGKKQMWFTHLFPPEEKYRDNTTTRTASYLIEQMKGARVPQSEINALGMQLLYSCDIGDFHVRGYAGMTHQDHFNHFYNLAEYFGRISFGRRSKR